MPKRKPKQKPRSGDAAVVSPRKRAKDVKNEAKPDVTSSKRAKAPREQPEPSETAEHQAGRGENGDQGSKPFQFTSPAETFAQLIHPMTVDTFFQDFWEKQPRIFSPGDAKKPFFQSLFSRTILEKIVTEQRVSFVQDCNVCRYQGEKRESLNGKGVVKLNQLQNLLDKSKATVQFHQPQRFQDNIWQLLEHLESFFGCLVGSNVYMTPCGSQGLAPHYDDVEVFVLQLEGEKRWRLYNPPIVLPRDYSKDFDQSEIGKPIMDIVLKAGDLMYFPRGTVHQAETPDTCRHSTHLTISTYQRAAWGDLLSLALPSILQTAISEAQSFRQGLPVRFYSDDQASSSKTTKRLKDLIGGLGKHIGSHGQEAANEMLCDFIANRLPPYCNGDLDFSPSGPMPSLEHEIRLRFPDHIFIMRRQPEDDNDEEEEEEEEEDGDDAEKEKFQLFVYHSLQPSRHEHMMCSEPKQVQGIQLPTECETALKTLKSSQGWHRVKDIDLEVDVRSQMMTSLWAEGLLEVRDS